MSKYKVVDVEDIIHQPDAYKEKMAKLQLTLYHNAVDDLLKEALKELFYGDDDAPRKLTTLFDLNGTKITNLLEIK